MPLIFTTSISSHLQIKRLKFRKIKCLTKGHKSNCRTRSVWLWLLLALQYLDCILYMYVCVYIYLYPSQVALGVKNPFASAGGSRHGFNSWVGKIPWSRKWQPTLVFLPGKSHGQRSLAGYSRIAQSRTRLKQLST